MVRRQRGTVSGILVSQWARTGFCKNIYRESARDGFEILQRLQIIRIEEVRVVATNKTYGVLKTLSYLCGSRRMCRGEERSLERVKLKSFTYEKTLKSLTSIKHLVFAGTTLGVFFMH